MQVLAFLLFFLNFFANIETQLLYASQDDFDVSTWLPQYDVSQGDSVHISLPYP